MTNILGVSCFYHDSAACILADGQLKAAAEEERFTRLKHDTSFPEKAARYCLKEAGLDVSDVDYLAFYQTAAFGEGKWCIQYVAPLRGHELATRSELLRDEPDHPNARQEYYKIQIGPLVPLPKPIRADKWRRITFLYTTGERLLKAHSIKDLIVDSDERRLLWQALRERASQSQAYGANESMQLDIDPDLLAELLGIREAEAAYTEENDAD